MTDSQIYEIFQHCQDFVRKNPMHDLNEFDAQEFFEQVGDTGIIDFFSQLYRMLEIQ